MIELPWKPMDSQTASPTMAPRSERKRETFILNEPKYSASSGWMVMRVEMRLWSWFSAVPLVECRSSMA
jgi:hypothetical protein